MLSSVTTASSLCDDVLNSATIRKNDLKPFNRDLISEDYVNRASNNHFDDKQFEFLIITANSFDWSNSFKQFLRFQHPHVSHPSRSSLWYNLLRRDSTRNQHKFQQAVERYPEDIR